MSKIGDWFSAWLGVVHPKRVTEECQKHLSDALTGKTIERAIQIPNRDGWFVVFLKMTDGTSVHFVVPQLDACMRVQIDKADGTRLHLPEIRK